MCLCLCAYVRKYVRTYVRVQYRMLHPVTPYDCHILHHWFIPDPPLFPQQRTLRHTVPLPWWCPHRISSNNSASELNSEPPPWTTPPSSSSSSLPGEKEVPRATSPWQLSRVTEQEVGSENVVRDVGRGSEGVVGWTLSWQHSCVVVTCTAVHATVSTCYEAVSMSTYIRTYIHYTLAFFVCWSTQYPLHWLCVSYIRLGLSAVAVATDTGYHYNNKL